MLIPLPQNSSGTDATRCKIRNYVHSNLRRNMARNIPANYACPIDGIKDWEIYHRDVFKGVELAVCIYWQPAELDQSFCGQKVCIAIVCGLTEPLENGITWPSAVTVEVSNNEGTKRGSYPTTRSDSTKNYWVWIVSSEIPGFM